MTEIHPGALLAAHVANCAADQGSFWPMHDRLFQSAEAHSWGAGDRADFATFSGYAGDLKLDIGTLQTCVQTNRHAGRIADNMRAASQLGIRSTPTFVVNGKLLVGAQPFRVWQQVLDELLANS